MRLKIFIVMMCVAFCGFQIFYSSGIVGVTKKPNHVFVNPGCICHDRSDSVKVWIAGPDSLGVGRQALYTISIAKRRNIAAGFNVAAFWGALGVHDSSETQLMRPDGFDTLELTHIQPKLAHGRDTISWSFWYKAPLTVGKIDTLYANGNSVDTSHDPSGDAWNFAPNFLVRIVATNSVAANENQPGAYRLLQNYPNPFNPRTTIQYLIPIEGDVRLSVFDIAGREVQTLVDEKKNSGVHIVEFDATIGMSSGVYLYRISVYPRGPQSGTTFTDVKKMVLLK